MIVIARLPEMKLWQSSLLYHCEPAEGRAWQPVLRLLRRYAPRNDNGIDCHCEAFRREAVAISLNKKGEREAYIKPA